MQSKLIVVARHRVHLAVVAALLASVVPLSSVIAQQSVDEVAGYATTQAHETWRESMRHIDPPAEGCYHASFPSINWKPVACVQAPKSYRSRHAVFTQKNDQTVGNGYDYVFQAPSGSSISSAVGSFPTVTGVTSEKTTGAISGEGSNGANEYTLQLNTNFDFDAAACNGYQTGDNSGCYSWQQYVLESDGSNGSQVFIQDWLENYGNDPNQDGGDQPGDQSYCPNGWDDAGPDQNGPGDDCVINSNSATISTKALSITNLASLKLAGTATASGTDKATVTYGTEAYTASIKDSNTNIASGWTQAEFNIFGNGGAGEASFNKKASVTVKLAASDGSTKAPTCLKPSSRPGTTGETNNLTYGSSCTTTSGSTPSIQFTESD